MPKIFAGTSQIKNIYVGTSRIKKVWVGTSLVYSAEQWILGNGVDNLGTGNKNATYGGHGNDGSANLTKTSTAVKVASDSLYAEYCLAQWPINVSLSDYTKLHCTVSSSGSGSRFVQIDSSTTAKSTKTSGSVELNISSLTGTGHYIRLYYDCSSTGGPASYQVSNIWME